MKCSCKILDGPEEIVVQRCALCKAAPDLYTACGALMDAVLLFFQEGQTEDVVRRVNDAKNIGMSARRKAEG